MEQKLYVYKSNELIREFKPANSLWEQKVINYICALIHQQRDESIDIASQEYSFNVKDIVSRCGLSKNGDVYDAVKIAIDKLQEKSKWIKILKDGKIYETTLSWILKSTISDGNVKFYADPDVVPMILDLQKNYTMFEVENILQMRKLGSIKLYELLKSYAFEKKKVSFSPDELLMLLNCDAIKTYVTNIGGFMRRVVEPAVEEINNITDLNVCVKTEKRGNQITEIIFSVKNVDKYLKSIKVITPDELAKV